MQRGAFRGTVGALVAFFGLWRGAADDFHLEVRLVFDRHSALMVGLQHFRVGLELLGLARLLAFIVVRVDRAIVGPLH